LYVVGDGAAPIHHGASLEGSFGGESAHLGTVEEALAVLQRTVRPGDAVLLKSARDAGLREIAGPLVAHPGEPAEDGPTTGADQSSRSSAPGRSPSCCRSSARLCSSRSSNAAATGSSSATTGPPPTPPGAARRRWAGSRSSWPCWRPTSSPT